MCFKVNRYHWSSNFRLIHFSQNHSDGFEGETRLISQDSFRISSSQLTSKVGIFMYQTSKQGVHNLNDSRVSRDLQKHIKSYSIMGAIYTWCRADNPSTFEVSISAPTLSKRRTSSLSPAAQAAKNTHSNENWIFLALFLGVLASRFVSDSSQRFSCSARLNSAELERFSNDILLFLCDPRYLCSITPRQNIKYDHHNSIRNSRTTH